MLLRWGARYCAVALSLAGCQNMNHTGSGALLGSGLGATAGAVIGGGSGHAAGGALIGAATGAITGGLAGNAADAREERDAAVAHAQYAQAQSNAAARALTSSDVIEMTRGGVGDDVIISSLRLRGCRFDGSPGHVIHLKQQGVSDRVLTAMQEATAGAPATAVVAPPPAVVYGAPPPPPIVYMPPGYYGPHRWGVPRPSWGPRWQYGVYW